MRDTPNPATSPRKLPRQRRSRELVEAILEATARVLPERGAAKTTTTRIAEVAGVSIGSLYQYFPNRDAVLAYLFDRGLEREAEALVEELERMADRPLLEVVDAVVRRFTELYTERPRLLRALVTQAPRLGRVGQIMQTRSAVARALADTIRNREDEVADIDPEHAAFVLINAVMGTYQAWVMAEPTERLPEAELNGHLSRLVLGYLRHE